MEELFNQLTTCFDVRLMMVIVLLVYLVLKVLSHIKPLKTVWKQCLTFFIASLVSVMYYYIIHVPIDAILPTYLLSLAFYDVIMKRIIRYMKIDYKSDK